MVVNMAIYHNEHGNYMKKGPLSIKTLHTRRVLNHLITKYLPVYKGETSIK